MDTEKQADLVKKKKSGWDSGAKLSQEDRGEIKNSQI